MKHYKYLLTLISMICGYTSYAQDCKVLMPEIAVIYEGACKKGLAHGKGTAKGENVYEGNFKKGLPHGQGRYVYDKGVGYQGEWKAGNRHGYGVFVDEEGNRYTGEWKDDMRHGEGSYYVKTADGDTTYTGIWEQDKYIGEKPERPYLIVSRRSIDRVTMRRVGDGNQLTIKIMQGGMPNMTVQDYRFQWSSGNELILNQNARGWQNLIYPFEGRIVYTTANKLRTSYYTVQLEFKINQPGEWELILHN